jgi:hypothetical protein
MQKKIPRRAQPRQAAKRNVRPEEMNISIGEMSGMGWFGVLCLLVGVVQIGMHVRRKQWPLVEASLDSVEGQIDVTPTGDDVAIQPQYIHKLHYTYDGRAYTVNLPERELHTRSLYLRINPKRPEEALFENKGLLFPILVVCTGIVLIAVAVANGV